jgi:tRNA (guanine-N7-)-methyltransferase
MFTRHSYPRPMSFGLSRSRELDDAPGVIGIAPGELPPLPDAVLTDHTAGYLDPRRWFPSPERPFEVEIGSGKGSFILQEAAAHPDVNYLAIEYEREFYRYAADRVRRRGLTNVRMLCANAVDFLRWRCPPEIIRTIHLYYSDPWPKAKHHKNRVAQDTFFADAFRVLVSGGELRLVTDHDELWAWCLLRIERWTSPGPPAARPTGWAGPSVPFTSEPFTPPVWADEGEVVGTNYERKFTSESKPPHAMVLRRR